MNFGIIFFILIGLLVQLSVSVVAEDSVQPPNVVFVLLDDVGWSDLGRHVEDSPVPTPFIDNLTARGVHLAQHYVHSVCSPSRAALLTGRYHVNTGLTNVLIPGTPAGLRGEIPTLPVLLSELGGYSTAMAGKWHLGHAQHKMTPIGRGFDKFTGMYMWDLDSYTKQMYELPWEPPLLIDWVSEQRVREENTSSTDTTTTAAPPISIGKDFDGRPYSYTYRHYAEPRHATEAITTAAEDYMRQHRASQANRHSSCTEEELVAGSCFDQDGGPTQPMFLYIAYTAAHSPLQPLPRHAAHCTHIPHSRRRDFCGLVVGLDEALQNLTASVEQHLGTNTIMIVASDNGGAAYFGGMNAPLRGAKGTPYEGGVRVPAFIVDFTPEQRYLGDIPNIPAAISEEEQENLPTENTPPPPPTSPTPKKPISVHYSRVYHGLFHMSDWLPTILSYARIPREKFPPRLDGLDFSQALRSADYEDTITNANICKGEPKNHHHSSSTGPRAGMLLELYTSEESVFNQSLFAYRLGDYKLIRGSVRDHNYYFESSSNKINSSHNSVGSYVIETIIGAQDYWFGKGQSDTLNIVLAHMWLHDLIVLTDWLFPYSTAWLQTTNSTELFGETDTGTTTGTTTTTGSSNNHHPSELIQLFNIVEDPCEHHNLARDPKYASIISAIDQELQSIMEHRPPMLPLHLQLDISIGGQWSRSHVSGDCSGIPGIKPDECRFTHSWVADEEDPLQQEGLMTAHEYIHRRAWKLSQGLVTSTLGVVVLAAGILYMLV